MIIFRDHTFHSAATVAADGTDMDIGGLHTLKVQIAGTSTSRNIAFLASINLVNFDPIMGMDDATLSPSISTSDTAKIFTFDVRGLKKVRMDLTAVAGGNVTVTGMAIGY